MIEVSPELQAFLKEEYDRCLDETLEQERENAIDRYNGEPYGDEEDGSSQVVSRATAETIDYMVPSILRTIVSGERVVEFVHRDTEKANEATETIMYLLMDEQDGYMILHDWMKSGLLEKNAVAMTYLEVGQPKRRLMQGVSAMALMKLEEEGFKIIEATQDEPDEDDASETETEGPTFTVAAIEQRPVKFCDAAVPNEEFYCSPDARTLTEAALKGRRVRKSLSDLVAMGYERDEVETISSDSHINNTVAQARDQDRYDGSSARSGMARMVWWHEEYVRFDANDDGIAELLYVQRSADYKIFAIDELEDEEDHPFEDWCPYPMPHRRVGQGLADKVMDLERIETVVLRQTLDGIYLGNNPSTYLHEDSIGENTIEDILTVRAGRVVRWRGQNKPEERGGTFDPGVGLTMLERVERMRESRTGITRLNMGLDEDTLNQTAKGQGQLIARGEQQEEYVARNFANAFAKLITKKARLLQRYGKPIWVPIDGKFKEVDPRQWPEDMIARARMGIGTVNKEQRIGYRREVMQMQMAALEAGLDVVGEEELFNSGKGFIKEVDLGDVAEFFKEPQKDEQGNPVPKPQKPDPEMMKVQADAQREQQRQQFDQQATAAKIQGEQQIAAVKLQTQREADAASLQAMREKAAAEQQLQREKAEFEAGLARETADREFALRVEQMNRDHELKQRQAAADAELSKLREGGRLDA